MADPIRIQRLSSILKRRIAEVLEHELSDPRARLVTITRIKLSNDLSTCLAFYSTLGSEGQRSAVAHMLEHARGYVQREAARVMKTRTTPRLDFQFDPSIIGSIEMAQKIDSALREDRVRRGLPPEEEPAAEAEVEPDAEGASDAEEAGAAALDEPDEADDEDEHETVAIDADDEESDDDTEDTETDDDTEAVGGGELGDDDER